MNKNRPISIRDILTLRCCRSQIAPRDLMFFITILKSLVRLDSVIYVITPSLISNTQDTIIVLIKLLSIELNVSRWRQVGAKKVYICKCPPGVI